MRLPGHQQYQQLDAKEFGCPKRWAHTWGYRLWSHRLRLKGDHEVYFSTQLKASRVWYTKVLTKWLNWLHLTQFKRIALHKIMVEIGLYRQTV